MSGSGESHSLKSTDVGDKFVSDCELITTRLASGRNGSDDIHGVKGVCLMTRHWNPSNSCELFQYFWSDERWTVFKRDL